MYVTIKLDILNEARFLKLEQKKGLTRCTNGTKTGSTIVLLQVHINLQEIKLINLITKYLSEQSFKSSKGSFCLMLTPFQK